MRDATRIRALIHARSSLHRDRVRRAREQIFAAFDANSAWYVALSGGKDSGVVLSLVREHAPTTAAVCSLPEFHLPETAAYLDRLENCDLVASGSDHATGWAPNWETEEAASAAGLRWLGAKVDGIDRTVRNYGRAETGVFLGLRADESNMRRMHMRQCGLLFFNQMNMVWQCNPIGHWAVLDVWAFILSNALDYNRAYDVLDALDLPLERQRIGPLAVERALGRGQLAILKRGWPDVFNRFAERHPEAARYI